MRTHTHTRTGSGFFGFSFDGRIKTAGLEKGMNIAHGSFPFNCWQPKSQSGINSCFEHNLNSHLRVLGRKSFCLWMLLTLANCFTAAIIKCRCWIVPTCGDNRSFPRAPGPLRACDRPQRAASSSTVAVCPTSPQRSGGFLPPVSDLTTNCPHSKPLSFPVPIDFTAWRRG